MPVLAAVLLGMAGISGVWAQEKGDSLVEATDLPAPARSEAGTLLQMMAPEKTGIDHRNPVDREHPLRRAYHSSCACAGAAIGDIDLDGKLDLFLGNGPRKNSLYVQRGDLTFENVAGHHGLEGNDESWAVGVAFFDLENDGDLDLYVTNYDYPNQLYVNQLKETGKLGFIERARDLGLAVADGSVVPAFADYDRDGDLDMYLLTHQLYRENGRPEEGVPIVKKDGEMVVEAPWDRYYTVHYDRREDGGFQYVECGRPDYLFRNDGEAGFVEVTREAGISTKPAWGNSVTWLDFNNDGWPDILVGNDFSSPDFLYRNNGDGTFTDVSKETFRHSTWNSMGSDRIDLNNDGEMDLIVSDMLPTTHYMQKASMGAMGGNFEQLARAGGAYQLMRNAVHINTGTDRFLEAGWMSGMATTDWTWSIRCEDFDGDGLADVFYTNGIPGQFNFSDLPDTKHKDLVGRGRWDHYADTPVRRERNLVFRNLGGFKFEETARAWGLDHIGMSYGASLGDLNGDGWNDLVVTNLEDPASVYRHNGSENNRVVIALKGRTSNAFGIGSRITVETAAGRQVRQLFPTGNYMASDEPAVHFGLGKDDAIQSLRIDWPSGIAQVLRDLEANRRYVITEPDEKGKKGPATRTRRPESPWFAESKALAGFGKKEELYNDFFRQSLLPFGLSQLGPGQAWGDVDGDGDADLFIGGSTGHPGQLLLNQTRPGSDEPLFFPVPVDVFAADAGHEDMGAAFIDADGDGDLDLYVASGSIECEPGDEVLRDRLYSNQGGGSFTKAPAGTLPDIRESSSVVACADYDRDGDLDIFVGTRSIPGQYPAVPRSVLLKADDGVFADVAEKESPGLEKVGLVNSALWSDVDSDGWVDLLVACDWGAVRLFRNREGKLEDATQDDLKTRVLGWWNGIAGGDIDNDGDTDYVATNLGLNTQYHASPDSPELIYYGDFDDTGQYHIVEANFEEENGEKVCYPRRGLSCSSRAMPFILNKMQTYHNYALASLTEIYDQERLDKALQHRATDLRTTLFRNDGEGNFEALPMPRLAQISPGFGVILKDVDLDGWIDCYLVQNHFTPQIETGPMDSGLSLLMKGTGNPDEPFAPVWPEQSGLEVPGDAKSLAATDLNLDGKVDFLVTVNNADPQIFLNRIESESHHPLRVRLTGGKGNPNGIGGKVTIKLPDGGLRSGEVYSGGGYLTDPEKDLLFSIPNRAEGEMEVTVRWPGGQSSVVKADAKSRGLQVKLEAKSEAK